MQIKTRYFLFFVHMIFYSLSILLVFLFTFRFTYSLFFTCIKWFDCFRNKLDSFFYLFIYSLYISHINKIIIKQKNVSWHFECKIKNNNSEKNQNGILIFLRILIYFLTFLKGENLQNTLSKILQLQSF